jgi:integrase
LNKVFVVLRRKCPDLPDDLAPHVCRHTWNDKFSEDMDKAKVSEETEKKMRSRLMGWSETSGTAATYTRRHVQRKAREASLALQKKITTRRPNES